ncbi:hypothetical protein PHYC_00616 [Phycisphaerales bacterium]|nr:hypothetical protein PHYC_00616 [Phycisphaerales bacterium]
MRPPAIQIPVEQIAAFCRRWRIRELSLFGSVLRPDFGPDSDIDVLVSYEPGVVWDFDDYAAMRDELSRTFGRHVDIVPDRAIRNPFLRESIYSTRRIVHAA